MKKISTVQTVKSEIFKEQKLTIGLDLGDLWSFYGARDEAGQVILEQKLPTTPEAMKQTFGKMPRSLMALGNGRLQNEEEKVSAGSGVVSVTGTHRLASDQPLVSATPMALREALVLRALQGQVRMYPGV